ncbi:hypothetical protein F5887DRAFT_968270 [Amanita rubescens]|nr:hypothetical protein F5887DRAFT_968270 [Amanita rubescens]
MIALLAVKLAVLCSLNPLRSLLEFKSLVLFSLGSNYKPDSIEPVYWASQTWHIGALLMAQYTHTNVEHTC